MYCYDLPMILYLALDGVGSMGCDLFSHTASIIIEVGSTKVIYYGVRSTEIQHTHGIL